MDMPFVGRTFQVSTSTLRKWLCNDVKYNNTNNKKPNLDASAQLYLRTNPLMRAYGRWRFLTYNCLIMQFVAFSLCLTSHFVPRLRKTRDFFFTTFAFPVGLFVVGCFWSIWFIAGREYIFPIALEPFYPPWLNHVTHTIIAPINLAELFFVRHQYSSDKTSMTSLTAYMASYTTYLVVIRLQTGRWVYPFLNKMDNFSTGAFIVGMMVFSVLIYKSGKIVHDFVHNVKSAKAKFLKRNSSSPKKE